MAAFTKAVKRDAKLRLALCGPAGSGKTYSLLSLASELGGPVAFVDTEHGSASKYADLFEFDVIEPEQFDPRDLIKLIGDAIAGGYKCICIDSLSHYWMGKGGELEMVDNVAAASKSGNSFTAWKTITPLHNQLVDTLVSARIHVLVSMRTKTEWVIEEDARGKKVPRKIGMQPIMRDGIEFEFDVCGDLDQQNNLAVTKSRCPALSGKVINRPGKEMAETLRGWLTGVKQTSKDFKMLEAFGRVRESIGDDAYYRILGANGYEHCNEILDKVQARAIYKEMEAYEKSMRRPEPEAEPQPAAQMAEQAEDVWLEGRE